MSTIHEKIEQLSTDIALTRRFVQGSDTETVPLGGVDTPTIRKLCRDIDARESAAAQVTINQGLTQIQQVLADGNADMDQRLAAIGMAGDYLEQARGLVAVCQNLATVFAGAVYDYGRIVDAAGTTTDYGTLA